jgi:formylglycine-generating enzyme required for sulfatase activity
MGGHGMRNCVIACVVLLAMAGTAFSETKGAPKELAMDLGGGVKMEMVLIPPGEFMRGSEVHKVNITKPFYLGKFEVTQAQWEAVMGNNPSGFKGQKNPVEQVSWDDCQRFLDKLNAKTGGQGGKFVLPTEAQWEYACRAGSTKKYCFGDDKARLENYAWYKNNSDGKPHAVGEKKPNAWGLYDMHGNVCEWCADLYDFGYYAKSPADDPRGPTKGSVRVFRGGGWFLSAWFCRSETRSDIVPWCWSDFLGLRVGYVVFAKGRAEIGDGG